ncbi:COP9 signalosome complex subunit 5 [[Candida] jaroonii]|uniref:COP9 signalosome complex subunit 5 n=1 Tax=[Candida] jaroonii TaxID=467808 RepID=A0ACA9YF14_9ASCO|nr:COP9 signalosome complex subunit 5 [[Candida] jaroonii]
MKDLQKISHIIKLDAIDQTSKAKDGEFYESLINDETVMSSRPWKTDVKYFRKVAISSKSVLKMSKHAVSGGNIEIMGMLVGKIYENTIVVNDVYGLPVEGTETRVNAQVEGYEYMVSYLTQHKKIKPNENIVGWYHSHPGYGCWLSGIDVATQALNQNFQDPYLAIVVDPKKSLTGSIEIGAFRTFPDDYKHEEKKIQPDGVGDKMGEFGMHADKYYPLDIEFFKTANEEELIKIINKETWINEFKDKKEINDSYDKTTQNKIKAINDNLSKLIKNNKNGQSHVNKQFFNNQLHSVFTNGRDKEDNLMSEDSEEDTFDSDMDQDDNDPDTESGTANDFEMEDFDKDNLRPERSGVNRNSPRPDFLKKLAVKRINSLKLNQASEVDDITKEIISDELKRMVKVDIQKKIFS